MNIETSNSDLRYVQMCRLEALTCDIVYSIILGPSAQEVSRALFPSRPYECTIFQQYLSFFVIHVLLLGFFLSFQSLTPSSCLPGLLTDGLASSYGSIVPSSLGTFITPSLTHSLLLYAVTWHKYLSNL